MTMIVVGIMIAAVMGSKDIVKSSEAKKFYQSYVAKWITITNIYQEKTNTKLTDSISNGGTNSYHNGFFDGVDMSFISNQRTLTNKLLNVGINPCKLISTNCYFDDGTCNPTCYKITGEFSDEADIKLYLNGYMYNNIPTNFIVLNNIPSDIASMIDTLIDSQSDGLSGNVIGFTSLGSYMDDENLSTITPIDYKNYVGQLINIGIVVEN